MAYFEHTEDHDLDCTCSYCLDVDPNKSIAREIERIIESVMSVTANKLDPTDYRKVGESLMRLSVLRRYVPTQELPKKFDKQVAQAVTEYFAAD